MTSEADLDRTWAIVPLRGLEDAKTRLGDALDAEERLELVLTMAARTLTATRDATLLQGTVLVTADPAAAALARGFGAKTLVQRLPGLNAALREARAVAAGLGASATLVVPIDLPSVSAAALDEVLGAGLALGATDRAEDGAAGSRGLVVLVPDRHGSGTNLLLTSPPDIINPAFGEDSRAAHRGAAVGVDARYLEVDGPLTMDIDTSDDLLASARPGSMPSAS